MLTDARSIPSGHTVRTDVCIVGGGAAGITLAVALANRSVSVTLLESGGAHPDPQSQELNQGAVDGRPYFTLDGCRLRLFGGTTNFWGGWCRPLDEADFDERDWVPHSGWPFAKSDLDPFYARAQAVCRLGPYDYEPGRWHDRGHRSLIETQSRDVTEMVFQINPLRFGRAYRATLQQAGNINLLLHANAMEIETDRSQRTATHIRAGTLAGTRFSVAARTFILAAGGLENPRLLLASRRWSGAGVGNERDLVGRFFSDHLHVPVGRFRPASGTAPFYRVRRSRDATVRGGLSLTEDVRRRERLLGCAVTLHNPDDPHDVLRPTEMPAAYASLRVLMGAFGQRRSPARLWHHVGNVLRDMSSAASLSYRKIVKPRVRTLVVGCRAEQAPNRDSRVTLDDRTDALGVPRVRLHWQLTAADVESFRQTQRIWARELVGERGQLDGLPPNGSDDWLDGLVAGGHHIGTTRMHKDPRLGVVNEHGRVHGIDNLYVAGSSVFPTAGWAPPTLTIVALALRLADHVQAQTAR